MTTHNYRGYFFTVNGDKATIRTNKGVETLPIADVLRFIDAAWNKFDRIREEVKGHGSIIEQALAVAVNTWEYDGLYSQAREAQELLKKELRKGATRSLEAAEVAAENASDEEPRTDGEYLDAIAEIMLTPAEKWTDGEVLDAIALQIQARAAAAPVINGSRADSPDFIAGVCYAVDYVENELGIDLSETGLAEYREENQE